MPATAQVRDDLLADARFYGQRARERFPRVERRGEMVSVEGRSVDRLLQVHPEHHMVQEEADRPLVLLITAWRPERHVRLAAAQDHAGRQGGPRPPPRGEGAREARAEREHLAARPQAET